MLEEDSSVLFHSQSYSFEAGSLFELGALVISDRLGNQQVPAILPPPLLSLLALQIWACSLLACYMGAGI